MTEMPANPKKVYGDTKVPLHLLPPLAEIEWAKAHANGADKYGPYNWHENPVEAMTYISAARRHLMAWAAGEKIAEDSGVHHLGHVMACCAILIDAEACGKMLDNRPELDTGVLKAMEDYRKTKEQNLSDIDKEIKRLDEDLARDLTKLDASQRLFKQMQDPA